MDPGETAPTGGTKAPVEAHLKEGASPGCRWHAWLGINASTGALLAAILLVGMAGELWSPLMPEYLDRLEAHILLIGLYGSLKDAIDAVAFYFGGSLAARFNTRRALLLFNALPLAGLAILFAWQSKYAVFAALPLVGIWNSISGPAMLRVVGDTMVAQRRPMAFSMQSIQKRLSSLLAYFVSGALVATLGELQGVQTGVGLAFLLVATSWLIQYRFMKTAVTDQVLSVHRPRDVWRQFPPQLRRLLVSDILARWCDGMPRELMILYCVSLLVQSSGHTPVAAAAIYVAVLLSVMNATSLLLYVPIGILSSKVGATKTPFIGLTFVFFALFPVALVVLGPAWGMWGLVVAFAIGGLREIGEPARKVLVTELTPIAFRTQAIGLYWASRSVGIMVAPLTGSVIWLLAGAEAMLWTAGFLGGIGTALFYLRFGDAHPRKG